MWSVPALLPDTFLPRPRLLGRLEHALKLPLTLIIAPAGYGKTTLLNMWVNERFHGRSSPFVAWIGLESEHTTLASFLLTVSEAIESALPGVTSAVTELLGDASERDAAHLLLRRLHLNRSPLLLILDDAHVLESGPALRWLDDLFRTPPLTLHVVMASRSMPSLKAISRLRVAGHLMEITQEDLRFTPEEVRALFAETFHAPLPDDQIEHLARRTEGWAVALQLAHQMGSRYGSQDVASLLKAFGGTLRQLYDYLANVVLEGLPEDRRVFLRRTAVLEVLDPALCNALLERDDATAVLAELERAGLFTFPIDASRTGYRYHTLFREFLQRHLEEVEGQEAVRRLHRRAASWLLEQGEDERAIGHLLAAGDDQAAAELIRAVQRRLFRTSRYYLLEGWLKRFPRKIAEAHPWLLLARARLLLLHGEKDQAEAILREAEPILRAEQDAEGLYVLYHDLATIARTQRGDFAAAEVLERQALAYALSDEDRAISMGSIARCRYMTRGPTSEAFEILAQAMDLAQRAGDPLVRAELIAMRGQLHSAVGELTAALDDFHLALDLMESTGHRHGQINILSNAAYHAFLLGQLDQAQALVERATALASEFEQETRYAYAVNLRGLLHQVRGEWDAARRDHEEALAIQQRLGERYEIPVTFNWLCLLHRREDRLEQALRRGQEGLALREKLGNVYEIGLSLIDLGAVHLERGALDEAERMWRRALDIFTAHDARYEQTQLHFYFAVLAHRRGDEEALAKHLEQAMTLARTYEHGDPPRCLYFFIADAAWTLPVMAYALRHDLIPECVDCLLPQLGRPALRTLLPLLEEENPQLRARAARLLGCLGDVDALRPLYDHRADPDGEVRQAIDEALSSLLQVPPETLRVQTLGGFRLWRGDQEITHWPRRSARDLFLVLLERAPHAVPKELLMETFWPESPPEKAAQSLRRAVTDLRRTLEPTLPPGLPSRYLRSDEGTYALVLPPGSWVDYEEFQIRARRLLSEGASIEELEAALDLYRGDYLPEALYEDWAAPLRERLREYYLRCLERLGQAYLHADRCQEAIGVAQRILAQDPWNEEAVLSLMKAYQRQGDLPAALRAYETHRARLRQDLDLSPRDDLTAFYEQLRRSG